MKNVHEKALDSMFGDMDDFESRKMFGGGDPGMDSPSGEKGFSVTITMSPNESHLEEEKEEGAGDDAGMEDLPADHDISLCKGGCAYHKGGTVGMAEGGMVPSMGETEDLGLPPFLRKKKLPSNR